MTFRKTLLFALMVGAFVGVNVSAVWAEDPHAGHHMMETQEANNAAERELNEAMAIMHRDMAVPYTGDADADFIRGMIPHHQGALEMAYIVLRHGDDPEAKKLARQIVRAQKAEIAWMRRWLELKQIPETGPYRIRQ